MTARLRLPVLALAACLAAGAGAFWPGASRAAPPSREVVDQETLRVCADPANLPFSNQAGEGFENRIAQLMAKELGRNLEYTWMPQTIGFVRSTLSARLCDLVIGVVAGDDLTQNTNPYYRSVYEMVYRKDSGLAATTLEDPALRGKAIGVVAGTPPVDILVKDGLAAQLRPYQLVVDTRYNAVGKQMIEDLAAKRIDVAVLWGPFAGYYTKDRPDLVAVPLIHEDPKTRLDFRIAMGTRFNEPDWKHRLNDIIARIQPEIDRILAEYNVPTLDEEGHLRQVAATGP